MFPSSSDSSHFTLPMSITFASEYIPFIVAHAPLISQLIKSSLQGDRLHDALVSYNMGIPLEAGLIINAVSAENKKVCLVD